MPCYVLAEGRTRAGLRNVRFGSLADISQCNRHARFTPECGHKGAALAVKSEKLLPYGNSASAMSTGRPAFD